MFAIHNCHAFIMDPRESGVSLLFDGLACSTLSGATDDRQPAISLIPATTQVDVHAYTCALQDSKTGSDLPDEAVGVASADAPQGSGLPAAAPPPPKTGRRERLSPEEARARINIRQMGYRERCRRKAEDTCAAVEQARTEIAALRLEQAELLRHHDAMGMLLSYAEDAVNTIKSIPKAASDKLRGMMLQWVAARDSLPSDTVLRCAAVVIQCYS